MSLKKPRVAVFFIEAMNRGRDPVLLLTAAGHSYQAALCCRPRFDLIMTKPFECNPLMSPIRTRGSFFSDLTFRDKEKSNV